MNGNVFISYHRKDSKRMESISNQIKQAKYNVFVIGDNYNFDETTHVKISEIISTKQENCNVVVYLIGKETYSRSHCDLELKKTLKGGPGRRKGLVGVLLGNRGDTIDNLDKSTISNRIYENEKYVVLATEKQFNNNPRKYINIALKRRDNVRISVINKMPAMTLRNKKYRN